MKPGHSVRRSDFWIADFGLEFLFWPEQKILKKEFHNNCACVVLESTNPSSRTNGYARVVSWIDEEVEPLSRPKPTMDQTNG